MSIFRSIGEFIGGLLWNIGEQAGSFSRTRSKRQQLEETARWDANHMGVGMPERRCVVCGRAPVSPESPCPGPPAAQRAFEQLRRLRK